MMQHAFARGEPLLPDILRLQGRWRSQKLAAITPEGDVSWGDLDARWSGLAHALISEGLRPGDAAVLMMGNGLPMLEAIFGAMRAGLIVVPLNLSVSDAALAGMISDCDARVIITTPDQAGRVLASPALSSVALQRLRFCAGPCSGWTDLASIVRGQPATPPDIRIDPDAPCNIIYSSGTTGLPKGIVHTHSGRLEWARSLALALRYHSGARTLVTIGMYSNISWVSLLCTLICGGTLVIAPGFDAAAVWNSLARDRITHTSMVPVAFQRLLDAGPANVDACSVQAMMSCGSPLSPELKARLSDRFGPVMIELYGLTEGVITTLDPEDAATRPASVGTPLMGTDIAIIDDDGRRLPPGEAGEIVATGPIVMPGYLNRPDATQEATWTDEEGRAWLRTGDIGRLDEAGFLYIVDRKKDMILSGGQNIYPQDIEAVLITHPCVAEAAVIPVRSARWGETPLGLVVVREIADPAEILVWANDRLGRQQRLAAVETIAELPRNPNGKTLKRELRQLYKDREYG